MSKKNKGNQPRMEFPSFDDEEILEEVELEPEVVAEEPVVEEPAPVVVEEKPKTGRIAIVTSLRSWIYPETDIFSKPVGGVQRGNQLNVLDGPMTCERGKQWFRVEQRNPKGHVQGFIELVRVKVQ